MGDTQMSKLFKEETPNEEDNRSLENLEVEKFERNQELGFSCEPAGIEKTCIVGTHTEHGKKPTKQRDQPLRCPRCESSDTKFCYFNNYNVNQPRHFCRKCQRYWTAGGLLRNVPRGAGRRRRFLHSQKALFPSDVGRLVSEDSLLASSTMLSFGQQRPLCEVMASHTLSMQHSNMTKGSFNEWCPSDIASNRQVLEQEGNDTGASTSISCVEEALIPITMKHVHRLPNRLGSAPHYAQKKDGNVSSSSRIRDTESNGNVKEEKGGNLGLCNRAWHHFDAATDSPTLTPASHCSDIPQFGFSSMKGSCIMGPSNNTSTRGHYDDSVKGNAMPMAADCAKASESTLSTTTWNRLPDAMWAHPPWFLIPSGPLAWDWAKAYWQMPWSLAALPSSTRTRGPGSRSVQAGSEDEGCLWVPKTRRIDDPVEAAQSSIWKTLGLDKASGLSASKEDSKEAFPGEAGTHDGEESSTHSHRSNPAALSRSLTFNETN